MQKKLQDYLRNYTVDDLLDKFGISIKREYIICKNLRHSTLMLVAKGAIRLFFTSYAKIAVNNKSYLAGCNQCTVIRG